MTRPHLPIPHLPKPNHHHHNHYSTSPSEKTIMPTGRGGAGNMRACTRVDRAAEQESTETMSAVEQHMAEIDGYLCPPHQQPEDQQALQRIHTEQLLQRQRSDHADGARRGSVRTNDGASAADFAKRRQSSLVELKDLLNPQNAGRRRQGSLLGSLRRVVRRRGSSEGRSPSHSDGEGDGVSLEVASSSNESTVGSSKS